MYTIALSTCTHAERANNDIPKCRVPPSELTVAMVVMRMMTTMGTMTMTMPVANDLVSYLTMSTRVS